MSLSRKVYKGKEPCQGCHRSGTEKPRDGKDFLCSECQKELQLGKAKNKELKQEYVSVNFIGTLSSLEFRDRTLSNFLYDFLKIISNKHVRAKESQHVYLRYGESIGDSYNIPKELVEPLGEYFKKLSNWVHELSEKKKAIPKEAQEAVQQEKTKIFNEGIALGRNLLIQLNAGEITLAQLEQRREYKEEG